MSLYFADNRKYVATQPEIPWDYVTDESEGQVVEITGSAVGITVRPEKRWTETCEKLFRQFKANGIWLDDFSMAPNRSLSFINRVRACERLCIENGREVDLSPLATCSQLEELILFPTVKPIPFDLTCLTGLRRCQIPCCPELKSVFNCRELVSLAFCGGNCDGILNLESFSSLEEFNAQQVSKLKEVVFNPRSRIRALQLRYLKELRSITPLIAVVEKLLVADLTRVPRLKVDWLGQARHLECLSLNDMQVSSLSFAKELKKLQVFVLFRSKVKDGNLEFLKSLKGKLDDRYWGGGIRTRTRQPLHARCQERLDRCY